MIARRVMSGLMLAWGPLAAIVPASEPTPAVIEQFEKQVRPLLAAKCWKCHGDQKQQASLRLDSAYAVAAGGDSGPAVVPGDPEHSPMIQAIRYAEDPKPRHPDGKLSDGEIALLTAGVKTGAPWPRYADDVQPADRVPATLPDPPPPGERSPLWALRAVADPDPPATQATPPPRHDRPLRAGPARATRPDTGAGRRQANPGAACLLRLAGFASQPRRGDAVRQRRRG